MNLPPIPKLPAALVGALGLLATVLGLIEPTLTSPWREIVTAALAVLTALGIAGANRAIRAHRDATAERVIDHLSGRRG